MPLQANRYDKPRARICALAGLLSLPTVGAAEQLASTIAPDAAMAINATPSGDDAETEARQTRWRTAALMAASVGGTLAYGRTKWWQDGFTGEFKSVNEGWFGRDTQYGGMDKLGHGMFAYAGTRLLTRAYEWAGNDASTALKLGVGTAVGTLMAVEVLDGYAKKWRFSTEDAIANLAGGMLGYVMEKNPAVDALLDLRLQYTPSRGPDGRRSFDPFGDYSGQRYHVVVKASGVPALRDTWARYFEVTAGYGTRNFENATLPQASRTRHAYFGVSLNLSEILRGTVYKDNARPSRTQRLTETFLEYVHIPAAGVQRDHVIR